MVPTGIVYPPKLHGRQELAHNNQGGGTYASPNIAADVRAVGAVWVLLAAAYLLEDVVLEKV